VLPIMGMRRHKRKNNGVCGASNNQEETA